MQHVGRIPCSSRRRRRLLEVLGLMTNHGAKRAPLQARNDVWLKSAGATTQVQVSDETLSIGESRDSRRSGAGD
jgi:hypothetical protein